MLALLVDNSLSMGISDGETARGEPVQALLEAGSPLRQGLDDRFRLLRMGFDAESRVLREDAGLDWRGSRTDIAGALRDVLTRTRHEALGGIVLFSDGADNGIGGFKEILADLQARRIPVHHRGRGAAGAGARPGADPGEPSADPGSRDPDHCPGHAQDQRLPGTREPS